LLAGSDDVIPIPHFTNRLTLVLCATDDDVHSVLYALPTSILRLSLFAPSLLLLLEGLQYAFVIVGGVTLILNAAVGPCS
jgi:hypothetical protein